MHCNRSKEILLPKCPVFPILSRKIALCRLTMLIGYRCQHSTGDTRDFWDGSRASRTLLPCQIENQLAPPNTGIAANPVYRIALQDDHIGTLVQLPRNYHQ